ncbi:MAG TPA: helix-turn-helix transcriptional regulator [Candidatus Ornithoclostridium faecavium]|nr:helix-turn-helix transcriptional regulator [Candidatus Ornithoclostridium faecavium]
MKFAERLKEQRIKHGYNQQYVANYMRVSQVSISNWERGLKEPSYQALVDLSQLFGKSTDYMLGFDEKNEEK